MNIFISSSVKENFKEVVELANQQNLNIEICKFADPYILDGDLDGILKDISDDLKDFKGELSLHGTFFDLNPASKDPKIIELTKYRYTQSFKIAKTLGAKTIVFHSGYNGLVKNTVYRDKFIENKINFWQDFIKMFEDKGIIVALENTYEEDPEIISVILDNVDSKYLKACIDTGHVNTNSNLSINEWILRFGKRLHHMHLHNNFGNMDEHNSLLSGTIKFGNVFESLKNNSLNPNLTVEVFRLEPALESVNLIKECFVKS